MNQEQRQKVVNMYGEVLEKRIHTVGPEEELPFPKEVIREVLTSELMKGYASDIINSLETGLIHLEGYVPYDEYERVRIFEDFTKEANLEAEEDMNAFAKEHEDLYESVSEIYDKIVKRQESLLKQIQNIRKLKSLGEND